MFSAVQLLMSYYEAGLPNYDMEIELANWLHNKEVVHILLISISI